MRSYGDGGKTAQKASVLISQEALRSLNGDRLVEAELATLTARMHANPALRKDKTLVERRNALVRLAAEPFPPKRGVKRRLDTAVLDVANLLLPWDLLYLSSMSDGIYEEPGVEGVEGGINVLDLYPGGAGYYCQVFDTESADPSAEKWWIRNWENSAVFPPAPFAGRLAYRFTVEATAQCYRASSSSGLIRHYVTIGTTADAQSQSVGSWNTLGWPIDVSLPTSETNWEGDLPILGSIVVEKGDTAALGFVYGLVVAIAGGEILALQGGFATRPTGVAVSQPIYGKIEYRFVPDWLHDTVDRALGLTLSRD